MDRNSSQAVDTVGTDPNSTAGARLWKTFTASACALAAGLALLLHATEEGNAFTTESLRRTAVMRQPQPIPSLRVTDGDGRVVDLRQALTAPGRVWIVEFVYTRCTSVCLALGAVAQQLQARIIERGLQAQMGLLSISFDPEHDDAPKLRDYALRMRMDPEIWRVVSLVSASDRKQLLEAFGIMVIAAPLGEFEHNAALHIVNSKGMLVRILDLDDAGRALDWALASAP